MDQRYGKRSLSESSTESEKNFKIPKKQLDSNPTSSSTSSSSSSWQQQPQRHFQYSVPAFQRRESQTSSTSATSVSEDDELEGQQLSKALDSTSESTDDDDTSSLEAVERSNAPDPPPVGQYSSVAQKMMSKMGYKSGLGLGKKGQGIVEPVGMSKQRGRRGLGLIIEGLEDATIEWDGSREHVVVEEEVSWMPQCSEPCPKLKELRTWKREGPRKTNIEDETTFCDEEVLSSILKCKSIFDRLEPEELRKARTRSNPFETIRGVFFLNRAAMKMANMDAVFDFMFTAPTYPDGKPMVNKENPLLYFADVCAGPGGFSEYVLWRKKWKSKGFGFTLRGPNDFKLEDFFAGPPETFEPHYGVNGREGDGDVFNEENIRAFQKFVLENTDGKGVHFMMADGGFSVDGQENIQEILSKQLYLCQFLVSLSIVRTGGHFVCKVFDLFTPFSVGLVYLMYRAFDSVCIHKPNTSRPANSERYLICKGKREECDDIRQYMFELNSRLNQFDFNRLGLTSSTTDILEVVPLDVIMRDEAFVDYVRNSNNLLGEWQIVGLAKIAAFCKDQTLFEHRQKEIRDQCLSFWKIPDQVRMAPMMDKPQNRFRELLGPTDANLFQNESSEVLTKSNLDSLIKKSPYDWKCVLVGAATKTDRGFFLGLGRSKTFFMKPGGHWEQTGDRIKFDLPANTLIYGEIIQEMRGETRSMRRMSSLHIIDALFLGKEDVRKLDYRSRLEQCRIFAKAINKPSLPDYSVIRAKEVHGLENIKHVISNLQPRLLKGGGMREQLTWDVELHASDPQFTRYFKPTGVLMFKIVRDPFTMAWSRTHQRKYWFNTQAGSGIYECPKEAVVDFKTSFTSKLLWSWDEGVRVHPTQAAVGVDQSKLDGQTLCSFVDKKLQS